MPTDHIFYRDLHKTYPTVDRGEGVYIWDKAGKRYLDGSGGACVVSIGHGVPEIREAMMRQAERIAFAHGSHFTSEAAIECSERLCALTDVPGDWSVYFGNGGSEAVETAVKLARQYWREAGKPDKYKVISRWASFHGNTTGALALGGHTGRRKHYQPLMLHTPHIEPAYCYRCPWKRLPENCSLECADALERCIRYEGPDSVSAFIAEPVVGATAGALVPKDGYWQRIRAICDAYDVLLISDEVMTGIGRCGENFALDAWRVTPDIYVCAKGVSSGYTPLGAVVVKRTIRETIFAGTGSFVHGHTYCQNPLSVAIGAAVMKYIEDHGLIARSREMGRRLRERLETLREIDIVGDVRGLGLFAAVEFVANRETKETFDPSLKLNGFIGREAFARGLITYPGGGGADGIRGDHVLICPPFVISDDQMDFLTETLRQAILAGRAAVGR